MEPSDYASRRLTVKTRSGEISYTDSGEGRVALFVHGLGTNGYLWRNVIGELSSERRCIAVDLPGHGGSPFGPELDLTLGGLADAVEGFCDALGLTDIDLVTNDTGGAVGQIFATRHAARLATLTLTNCEAHDNIPNEAFRGTVELAKSGQLAALAGQMLTNMELNRSERGMGSNYEHPETLTEETVRFYLEPVVGTPDRVSRFQQLLSSLGPDNLLPIESALRKLTVPTLIVWATADIHFALSWAYWLRDTIPGTRRVVEIEGAKLHFPVERASELVTELRRHWAAC